MWTVCEGNVHQSSSYPTPQDNGLKEDAPEHGRDSVNEVKAEQKNEPCSSSSSESDLQVVYDIHATSQVKLGAVCLDLEFDPQTHEKLLGMGWRGASAAKSADFVIMITAVWIPAPT